VLNEIEVDFENVRMAWHWAVEHENFNAIESAFETFAWYCAMRSAYAEAMVLYRLACEGIKGLAQKPARLACRLLLPLPFHGSSRNPKDQDRIRQALELARKHHDRFYEAYCLYELAIANPPEAVELLESSIQMFRQLDDPFYEAVVLQELAFAYTAHARHEDASLVSDEAIGLAQQYKNQFVLAWALGSQAWAALLAGRYDEALPIFYRKQALHEEQGELGATTLCMVQIGLFDHFLSGDFDLAREYGNHALQVAHETNYPPAHTWASLLLGLVACVEEDYREALRCFQVTGE